MKSTKRIIESDTSTGMTTNVIVGDTLLHISGIEMKVTKIVRAAYLCYYVEGGGGYFVSCHFKGIVK